MKKINLKPIIAVILLAALALVYVYGYKPLTVKIESTRSEVALKEAEYQMNMNRIQTLQNTLKFIEAYQVHIAQVSKEFYTKQQEEEHLVTIRQLEETSGVNISRISYTGVANITSAESIVGRTNSFTLNFNCTYLQLLDLLGAIDTNSEHIVGSALSINGAGEQLNCNMTIAFYHVVGVDEYLDFEDYNNVLESNPIPRGNGGSPF